ncbi:MAG: hypothetical protein RR764_11505, partial [Oscillospiraceae bacterium]
DLKTQKEDAEKEIAVFVNKLAELPKEEPYVAQDVDGYNERREELVQQKAKLINAKIDKDANAVVYEIDNKIRLLN